MNRRAQTYTTVRAYDMYYVHVTRGTQEWAIYMHWYIPPVLWEQEYHV